MNPYDKNIYAGFKISEDEVSHFKETHLGFCRLDVSRVSQFLLIQLASISKHKTYNSFSITDVIQDLEGVGRGGKRRVDQFKHLPLRGFWKAHFFDAQFIARNLINHWGLEFENSQKFNALCSGIADEEVKIPSKAGWQGRLSHEMIMGAYEERARNNRLTGEWIIFSRHNNNNYYLCISRHTTKEQDQPVFNFLKTLCEHEYPFLLSANAV
jgi:hypothetical protein